MIARGTCFAALAAFIVFGSSFHAHADPRYEREHYFPRRTFDLIAHGGVAVAQSKSNDPGLVVSGTGFLRLSSTWGGPTIALDVVRRSLRTGGTKTDGLLYLSHRIAFTRLARVEPWLEPIGIGLGFYRPAVGVDVFVVPDMRFGCAAKVPIFFSPTKDLLDVGVELTAGLTVQLGPSIERGVPRE